MTLLVDIGNTRMKYVSVLQDGFSKPQSIDNTEITDTFLKSLFLKTSKALISCVANSETLANFERVALEQNVKAVIANTTPSANGIVCGYDNYQQLGVDRWLAILGAEAIFPKRPLIIVDSGTATTIDVINDDKKHLGGWILPGVQTLHDAITEKAVHVHSLFSDVEDIKFGTNTAENVNQASWAATLGLISTAIETLKNCQTISPKPAKSSIELVFTGGNSVKLAKLYADKNPLVFHVVDDLVFYGLVAYEQNESK